MKLLIAGGGTGGHLFPAIAIAKEFLKADKKNEVLFVGTKRGLEKKILEKENFNLEYIRAEPMAGKGIISKIKSAMLLPVALLDSVSIMRRFNPNFVLGVGGYASGPVVLGAKVMGIKTGIQEQNIFPGAANKILGKFVNFVFLAFKEAAVFFSANKINVTGNPVRESLFSSDANKAISSFGLDVNKFTIFIFGGSLGAQSINKAVVKNLNKLDTIKDNIQIIHQTGEKEADFVKEAYKKYGVKAYVAPFIFNMNDAYKVADVIVCRAGATSISEIAALGKAAVLVPYPFAAGDHQKANAEILANQNAAIMIEDKDLNNRLMEVLLDLYNNVTKLEALKNNISKMKKVNAAQEIVKTIMEKEF